MSIKKGQMDLPAILNFENSLILFSTLVLRLEKQVYVQRDSGGCPRLLIQDIGLRAGVPLGNSVVLDLGSGDIGTQETGVLHACSDLPFDLSLTVVKRGLG